MAEDDFGAVVQAFGRVVDGEDARAGGCVAVEAARALAGKRLGKVEMVAGLRRRGRGIGHEDERDRLGRLLGVCIVKDEAVHARLACCNVVGAHCDPLCLAPPNPCHAGHAEPTELLVNGRLRLLVGIEGGRGGARVFDRGQVGAGAIAGAWMLEEGKVDGLFVRLDAPRDAVSGLDLNPADEVGLMEGGPCQCTLRFGRGRTTNTLL